MHVGYFSTIMGRKGGPAVVDKKVIEAISALDRKNIYTVYGITSESTKNLELQNGNVKIKTLRPSGKWLAVPFGLTWELKKTPVDLLHATIIAPPIVPCKFALTMTCWSQYDQPELYAPLVRMRLLYLLNRAMKNATAVFCYTNYLKDKVIERFNFDPERIFLLQPAVDSDIRAVEDKDLLKSFLKEAGIEWPYILFLGTLTKRKNVVGLIEAYANLVRQEKIEHRLVLLGERGYGFNDISRAVRENGIEDRVRFLGRYPHSQLPFFYTGADVFVFPTFSEGFGLPPLEAMACGTPVVAANATSVPEVVGDAALMADPYKPDEIADAILKILADKQLHDNLIKKGFVRAAEFTWERAAAQAVYGYEKIYNEGW